MSKYKYEKQFMFSQKKIDQVRWFLKDKKNIDISVIKDDKQNSVLHQCAYQGNLPILKEYMTFMIQYWKNQSRTQYQVQKKRKNWINLKNKQGYTCLHYAGYKGYINIIDELTSWGADFNQKTKAGLKILHLAAQGDQVKTFIYFRGKIDINQPDQKGSTPLHWAAFSGSEKVTQYLLCQKSSQQKLLNIKIDAQDSDQQTPLHLATANGNTKIVRRLLIAGANRHIKNNQNQKPIDIARQNQFFSIQNFLNDNYNWLDYVRFFLNIKMKYEPKKRSIKMPLLFISFSVALIAFITLGLEYPNEYSEIFYVQEGVFGLLLLLYLSLIVGPNRLKRGHYQSIIHKSRRKQSDFSDGTIVSSSSFQSMLNSSTQIEAICLRCVQYKPVRAYHCDVCNTCIQQYDHHCPWINNCVGKDNIKRFIFFLILLFIVLNWIIVITVQFFMVLLDEQYNPVTFFSLKDWVKENRVIMYVYVCITTFLYLFFVIPLFFLLCVQILNLLLGRTTYERFSKANQSILSRSQREFIGNNSGKFQRRKQKISVKNCINMCFKEEQNYRYLQ